MIKWGLQRLQSEIRINHFPLTHFPLKYFLEGNVFTNVYLKMYLSLNDDIFN